MSRLTNRLVVMIRLLLCVGLLAQLAVPLISAEAGYPHRPPPVKSENNLFSKIGDLFAAQRDATQSVSAIGPQNFAWSIGNSAEVSAARVQVNPEQYMALPINIDRFVFNANSSGSQFDLSGWKFTPNIPSSSLFSGAATHHQPLEIPPARVIGPSLALNYNSGSTNGKKAFYDAGRYGEGWSMSGFASIRRDNIRNCYTPASGNQSQCFDPAFTLNMGGSHSLVPIGNCSDTNSNCQLYEAKGAPTLSVEYHRIGGANHAGEYWIVRDTSGKDYRFGYNADSEQVIARIGCEALRPWLPECEVGSPRRKDFAAAVWHLDKVSDPNHNQMVFQYGTEIVTGNPFFGCAGQCREVDVWPELIRYNNKYNNSSSTDPNHWMSEVDLTWRNTAQTATDGAPIFITAKRLKGVHMRHRATAGAAMADVWRYDINMHWYPCYDNNDALPGQPAKWDPACANGTSPFQIIKSVQRVEPGEVSFPTAEFSYYGEGNDQGVGNQSDYNEAKRTGTHDYEIINANGEPEDVLVVVRAPMLKRIENGYGGVHEIIYAGGSTHFEATSWYVKELHHWDGVERIYGQSVPTSKTVYGRSQPCYDMVGQCDTDTENPSGKLVGFGTTVVRHYNGWNTFLGRTQHDFYIPATGGNHEMLYGKPRRNLTYTTKDGPSYSSWSYMEWAVGTANCPQDGRVTPFACMYLQYDHTYDPSGSGVRIQSTQTQVEYNPSWQGGRQYGNPTLTTIHTWTNSSSPVLRSRQGAVFIANDDPAVWRMAPAIQMTWEANWRLANATLYLYEMQNGKFDPDTQPLTRASRLQRSRVLVNLPATPTASGTSDTLDAIDTIYGYTEFGLAYRTTTYSDYGEQGIHWGYGWDSIDTWASKDPAVNTIQFEQHATRVNSVTDALGHKTTVAYGGADSSYSWVPSSVIGANGLTTRHSFNALGQLEAVRGPEITNNAHTSARYEYNLNHPVQVTQINNEGMTSATGQDLSQRVRQTYDGLGRLVESRVINVPDETDNGTRHLVTAYAYDGVGRAICVSEPILTSATRLFGSSECWAHPHVETTFDGAGRAVQTVQRNGNKLGNHAGNKTVVSFAANNFGDWIGPYGNTQVKTELFDNSSNLLRRTIETYNKLGQLVWIGEFNDQSSTCTTGNSAEYVLTEYGYNAVGNLTTVTRGKHICNGVYSAVKPIVTQIAYDNIGRKISLTDPDMGTWTYSYDARSNLIKQTGGSIAATCAAYDVAGRITLQWTLDSVNYLCDTPVTNPLSGQFLASYTYHATLGQASLGQAHTVRWNPQTEDTSLNNTVYSDTFYYNSLGLPSQQDREINGQLFTQHIDAYDRMGRPTLTRDPEGKSLSTTYDYWGANSLQLNNTGETLVSNVQMNTRGQTLQLQRGNNLNTNYIYSANPLDGYHLLEVAVKNTATHATLSIFDYQYDQLNQITRIDSTINGGADMQMFSYDKQGRLLTSLGQGSNVINDYSFSYQYDILGSLTNAIANGGFAQGASYEMGIDSTSVAPAHAVTKMTQGGITYAYQYDELGRMTVRNSAEGQYTQEFTELGRMTKVSIGSDNTHFAYDTASIRVLAKAPDGTLIYTPFPNYMEEGAVKRSTYSLGGASVAVEVSGNSDSSENGLFYMHGDHLGSLSLMSHGRGPNKGTFVNDSDARYLPFGDLRADNVPDRDAITDRGFTGHRENRDIGLTYMNARYYAPELRRFISADTILPDPLSSIGFNRFAYVNNNPLNLIDPSGHCGADPQGELLPNGQYEGDVKRDECISRAESIRDSNNGNPVWDEDDPNSWWTLEEMQLLEESLANARTALWSDGILWEDTSLPEVTYRRDRSDSWRNGLYNGILNTITFFGESVTERTIWHEMGHAISRYARVQNAYIITLCETYDGCSSKQSEYCIRGFLCTPGQAWADAFALYVHMNTYGQAPDQSWWGPGYFLDGETDKLAHICQSVSETLSDSFDGNGGGPC